MNTMDIDTALSPPEDPACISKELEYKRAAADKEYVQTASVIMKTAFEFCGETHSEAYPVYARMSQNPEVSNASVKLAQVVYESLGKIKQQREKQAGWLADAFNLLGGAASATRTVTPEALRSLAFLGVTGGALAGGSVWATKKAIEPDDQKSRELEIQRDTYRRLTAEVQDELKRRNLANTPTNTAAVVDYLT